MITNPNLMLPHPALAMGVDVGGTHMRAALVDVSGAMVKLVRKKLPARTPEGLLAGITAAKAELGFEGRYLPMGIGLAAQIWVETGTVAVAPNLGWRDVPFGTMLREHFEQSVRLVNDLNAITYGEGACGAGERASDVLCTFVGTGVGMGAVCGGAVIEGGDGLATELGHIKVDSTETGRLCGCGERGCLEAYSSGRHLPALLRAKIVGGLPTTLSTEQLADDTQLGADHIEAAALRGDAAARALWDDIAELLGKSIGNAITLFNPRVLVLGGGVMTSAPRLKERVVDKIQRYAAKPARAHLSIRDTRLGDTAGVIGSGLLAHLAQ